MSSRTKLKDFYEAKPERRRHSTAFDDWFMIAHTARWQDDQDTRATFGQTDVATGNTGRTATVFDIGGNEYRVIAHVDYTRQTVKIDAALDHKEHDKGLWKKLF